VLTMRRFLPAIANTPRRAAISTALIAGLAAGPLAGHGTGTRAATPAATPTANPVVAAVTGAPAAAAPAGPSQADLLPGGVPGDQSHVALADDQVANARAIIHASKDMNLPPRAAVIAVATSLQESKLHNLGHLGDRNDHDSLGLFQQRPSTGWGTPEQITDPDHATKAFLGGLQRVPGWQTMPLTDAAQTVQVSAFGLAYAQWEQQAAEIVAGNYNA
jgi:hypothetical protein